MLHYVTLVFVLAVALHGPAQVPSSCQAMVGRIVVFARLCPISALISEKAVLLMLRPDLPDVSRTSK